MLVVYPGSFDLFHAGHLYVYEIACKIFGKNNVHLCIATNSKKKIDKNFIKWTLTPIAQDKILIADGLVSELNPTFIIRGLRDSIDLSTELTMADVNKDLGCETIFIPCTGDLRHISSSTIKELYEYNALTPERLSKYITEKAMLSFERWKGRSISPRKLFCGKIAIGKSFYIKSLRKFNDKEKFCGDCDQLIWQFFTDSEKKSYKDGFRKAINLGNVDIYQTMIRNMATRIDWYELFNHNYLHYEVSALGQWINYIPLELLSRFQIVEMYTSTGTRKARLATRNISPEDAKLFDVFYKSPYFKDEYVLIE